MEDIAPELLEVLKKRFEEKLASSERVAGFLDALVKGAAGYAEAGEYAYEVGSLLAEVFRENLSGAVLPDGKMYWNIAQRVIAPLLGEDHNRVSNFAVRVQDALNQAAGFGLKAQAVPLDEGRVSGILNRICAAVQYDDVAWMLDEPVRNFSQAVVDETLRKNAEFQWKAGLQPRIVRRAERGCCEWCSKLEGVYSYPDVPEDIYRRHERCRCVVEYDPGNGRRQDVWTKQWTDSKERVKIEERKKIVYGSRRAEIPREREERRSFENPFDFAQMIAGHPKMLQAYTPKALKAALENAGYEVAPLNNGSFKGVAFEDGGGYKVNFADGGLLMYHPEERSHHGGAYYKISTGKGGKNRYDLKGETLRED